MSTISRPLIKIRRQATLPQTGGEAWAGHLHEVLLLEDPAAGFRNMGLIGPVLPNSSLSRWIRKSMNFLFATRTALPKSMISPRNRVSFPGELTPLTGAFAFQKPGLEGAR